MDSPVLLMHYDPSDPGSLIAIQILPSDVINVSGVAIPRGNEFRKIERFQRVLVFQKVNSGWQTDA